mmetsp:Transcript_26904/g.107676  ORF Transcript_26904/g.107676 Transcript_26904/m.107676 type:complete len:91 (+) Transcript_26904:1018-1290(+)
MGVVECLKHDLLHAYPVLYARPGDCVVQFKFTVLILPSGPTRITGLSSFDANTVRSEKEIDTELSAIMAVASKKKKKKPRKKTRVSTTGT